MADEHGSGPVGLAGEALRRGKRLRRRRMLVRRGATSVVLLGALATGIVLRVGGSPSAAVRPAHGGEPATTTLPAVTTSTSPTTGPTGTTVPPTTAPPTTTTAPTTTVPPTTTPPSTVPQPCDGAQLTGTFAQVPGGSSAGHVEYLLTLTNGSQTTCTLSGMAGMQLLDANGNDLPTTVAPNGAATGVLVTLDPGASAYALSQFSPDVPGPGEPTSGTQCEPTAVSAVVSPPSGTGTLTVPLQPASPVCEHGTIVLTTVGSSPPQGG
jgi:hypothetical protein